MLSMISYHYNFLPKEYAVIFDLDHIINIFSLQDILSHMVNDTTCPMLWSWIKQLDHGIHWLLDAIFFVFIFLDFLRSEKTWYDPANKRNLP